MHSTRLSAILGKEPRVNTWAMRGRGVRIVRRVVEGNFLLFLLTRGSIFFVYSCSLRIDSIFHAPSLSSLSYNRPERLSTLEFLRDEMRSDGKKYTTTRSLISFNFDQQKKEKTMSQD